MEFLMELILNRVIFFNYCIYILWTICNGLLLYLKMDYLKIPKLLVVTAFFTMVITLSIKLVLVHRRDFTSDISKLTRFFLLTILIQMPLVSFFLISFSILLCTPLEVILHGLLLTMTLIEGSVSFLAAWKAVKHASNQYPPRERHPYFAPIEVQMRAYDTEVTRQAPSGTLRPRV